VIEARLPERDWPDRDLRITAVDARNGRLRVFTAADGVDLVDVVAASCAVPGVWPPATIGGRRYLDGGTRSTSNADLAAGCDEVLVIAPMPELPMAASDVKRAIADLERSAQVVTIQPDEASVAAMGANPLDPATAPPAATAGRAQAAAYASQVAALWSAADG
jgi:NTE family protein